MLIYNSRHTIGTSPKAKKEYKSISKRKHKLSQKKVSGATGQKKINKSLKKKLSKKNKQYLEGLGLKVKQKH